MDTPIKTSSTKVAHYKLRRLALRSARILSRHLGKSPALDLFEETLIPIAHEFIEVYDASKVKGPQQNLELTEGREAIHVLRSAFGAWQGHLAKDVAEFSLDAFRTGSQNPDDILADAERLIALINQIQSGDQPLAYGETLLADIEPKLEAAKTEWTEAQDALATRQESQAQVRHLATKLQRELVAFRSVLRSVLSSSHRDYQKIRIERASAPDPDDGEEESAEVDGASESVG